MKQVPLSPLTFIPKTVEFLIVGLVVLFVLIVAYDRVVNWTGSRDYLREATQQLNDQPPDRQYSK